MSRGQRVVATTKRLFAESIPTREVSLSVRSYVFERLLFGATSPVDESYLLVYRGCAGANYRV